MDPLKDIYFDWVDVGGLFPSEAIGTSTENCGWSSKSTGVKVDLDYPEPWKTKRLNIGIATVKRNLREWPTCKYGGIVALRPFCGELVWLCNKCG